MTAPAPLEPIYLEHAIDPTVDCVFKALFGSEENKDLLIDFLNSVLQPATPIVDVTLLNPSNDKPRLDAKETSVDVKARDASGAVFQVDVQLVVLDTLPQRMLYNWATLYSRELSQGEDYERLRPVTSIWVLRRNLWECEGHHHRFEALERDTNLVLSQHFSIHTLELAKWTALSESPSTPEDFWMCFLRDARTWKTLPEPLTTLPQMRHAMTVLKKFSDDELAYDNYLSRLDRERDQRGLENYAKNMEAARNAAVAALDAALAELQDAKAQAAQVVAQAEAHAAEAEAHAAEAEAHAAEAEAHAAEAEVRAAQIIAQAEAQAAQEAAARAEVEAKLREAQQQMIQTLQTLYTARFGVIPAVLAGALEAASLAALTAWLPLFTSGSASEIRALIPSDAG